MKKIKQVVADVVLPKGDGRMITKKHVGRNVVFVPDGTQGVLTDVKGWKAKVRYKKGGYALTDKKNLILVKV